MIRRDCAQKFKILACEIGALQGKPLAALGNYDEVSSLSTFRLMHRLQNCDYLVYVLWEESLKHTILILILIPIPSAPTNVDALTVLSSLRWASSNSPCAHAHVFDHQRPSHPQSP
jgi:hypothetical protein